MSRIGIKSVSSRNGTRGRSPLREPAAGGLFRRRAGFLDRVSQTARARELAGSVSNPKVRLGLRKLRVQQAPRALAWLDHSPHLGQPCPRLSLARYKLHTANNSNTKQRGPLRDPGPDPGRPPGRPAPEWHWGGAAFAMATQTEAEDPGGKHGEAGWSLCVGVPACRQQPPGRCVAQPL